MLWRQQLLSVLLASTVHATPTKYKNAPQPVVNSTVCNGESYVYEEFAGYGFLPSDFRDKFGDTAGGWGSSATIDHTTWKKTGDSYSGILWGIPDRGWNTEGTLNFMNRVHKFKLTFTPNASATVEDPSPPNVKLQYLDTILFTDPTGTPLSGLDANADGPYLTFPGFPDVPSVTYTGDGFGLPGPGGHRIVLDSEGLVLNSDGSFWVSDEYGPYIYHFSPAGKMLGAIRPPEAYIPRRNGSESFSANSPPIYNLNLTVIPGNNPTGRDPNQGFEGLTASPDGKTLYALMQSALDQEGGLHSADRRYARFVKYDVTNPAHPVYVAEYVVPLPTFNNNTLVAAQSEIHYISDTQFLVLARDSGKGHGQSNSLSLYRHADVFDISTATDLKSAANDCPTCAIASSVGVLDSGITPATYCSFLDYNVNSELGKFGLHNGGAQDLGLLNEKWESLVLVPVNPGAQNCPEYFLISITDNDFITQNGYMDGGKFKYADESGYDLLNQVLVFKITLPAHSKPRLG